MLAPTTVAELRLDLGDTGTPPAFTDAELSALLARAGNNGRLALAQGLWQLLTQAARLNDYTIGQSDEKRSQVFAQLQAAYKLASTGGDVGTVQTAPIRYGTAVATSEFG